MKIYVSTIIEYENKFLLVKEMKKHCYGKWNLPSGHVEENEYIFNAAIREVKEETNLDVELKGLISVYNNMFEENFCISFVFASKIDKYNEIKFDEDEIKEVNWYSFEEIRNMSANLRDSEYIINVIEKYINNDIKPLDTIIIR
ncbi:MAG: NUDIX domain-containing protein [Clostridia bacterium]|nr:NUDIX domain-containing protein [Clostridia bacterium]